MSNILYCLQWYEINNLKPLFNRLFGCYRSGRGKMHWSGVIVNKQIACFRQNEVEWGLIRIITYADRMLLMLLNHNITTATHISIHVMICHESSVICSSSTLTTMLVDVDDTKAFLTASVKLFHLFEFRDLSDCQSLFCSDFSPLWAKASDKRT